MMIKKTTAFTLVELLIVVGIIGILSILILAVVNPDQLRKQAKDTSRQKDLSVISGALEQYYADNNAYPAASGGDGNLDCLVNTLSDQIPSCDGTTVVPSEPVYIKSISLTQSDQAREYCYAVDASLQNYILCAPYEQDTSHTGETDVSSTLTLCAPVMASGSYASGGAFGRYCVENPF